MVVDAHFVPCGVTASRPKADAVEKALRRERKKLRQKTDSLEKGAAEAKQRHEAAAAVAAALEDTAQKLAEAGKAAPARGGAKPARKTAVTVDLGVEARREADNAKLVEKEMLMETERARQAVDEARAVLARPPLLLKLESAWLSAVTEAWSPAAANLGGLPTTSHVHAWAKDVSLRQRV